MIHIAIFASGSGSNAENLIRYFANHPRVRINLVLSNSPAAFVLERAKNLRVPSLVFSKTDFYGSDTVLKQLQEYRIDRLVLAGFLWLIPENLLAAFPKRIINIHPALLPKYGGRGMYGMHVHRAVVAAAETETGITIHSVDAEYDRGEVIFQARCAVQSGDTPETVAAKVHELEYKYFPEVVEKWTE
ncbi:MAG: phosphoribosylglycinamide formyltransferase [Prevotellaceae bacterium]|jgi:phosphoribosylglycinamide formyltransferase-1|nr:phosphoribosylglycinamide formyltransferase [Prevotellaceae bacterium]